MQRSLLALSTNTQQTVKGLTTLNQGAELLFSSNVVLCPLLISIFKIKIQFIDLVSETQSVFVFQRRMREHHGL